MRQLAASGYRQPDYPQRYSNLTNLISSTWIALVTEVQRTQSDAGERYNEKNALPPVMKYFAT